MSFAENFKKARTNAGFTQQQVADALSLDRSSIAHYESGKSVPSMRNLNKICEMFEITPTEILK